MLPHVQRHPRVQNVTTAGTALAVALLPVVIGVLLARAMAADPLTPVNTLVTSSGQRARIAPSQWRGYGRGKLRGWRRAAARGNSRARPAIRVPPRAEQAGRAGAPPAVRVRP